MTNSHRAKRTATLDSDWQDLTYRHELCRTAVEKNIGRFPNPVEAIYIVGAIGAGKSLLLQHGFKYAWLIQSKPAIYLDLSDLMEELINRANADGRDMVRQGKLQDYFEDICLESINEIHNKIEENEPLSSDDYLPGIRQNVLPAEYFSEFEIRPPGEDDEYESKVGVENPEEVSVKEDELIVFIDEMEDGYRRLDNHVEGTTGALRKVVDKIEKGESQFYMIGAFGYASAHELGEAESRRVQSVNLPIIRPRQVDQMLERELSAESENYAWWHSRGRPGWLQSALDAKANFGDHITGTYDRLVESSSQRISRVEAIDRESVNTHLNQVTSESKDRIAYLLTNPSPQRISEFDDSASFRSAIESEASDFVLCDVELTPVEDVYKKIEDGFEGLDAYHDGVSDVQLTQFGERVLQGIANEDGDIVFGQEMSPSVAKGDKAVNMILRPLVRRMHDIALEELDDENEETIEFLYSVSQDLDQSSTQDIYQDFSEFFELFSSNESSAEEFYVSIGLNTPSIAFPSLITNPRMTFAGHQTKIQDQYQELIKMLEGVQAASDRLKEFGEILKQDPR